MGLKIYKIIQKIIFCIIIAIILFLAYFVIVRIINKDKPIKLFGYYLYEVSSWSMYNENKEESIAKGDLIFVKENDQYEVGMIVTYQINDEIPVTHVIVDIDNDKVITQGINEDGNKDPDVPINVNDIIGEVKGVWRNYRLFVDFLVSPWGIASIIGAGFILIEVFVLIGKFLEKQEEEKKTKEDLVEIEENNN